MRSSSGRILRCRPHIAPCWYGDGLGYQQGRRNRAGLITLPCGTSATTGVGGDVAVFMHNRNEQWVR